MANAGLIGVLFALQKGRCAGGCGQSLASCRIHVDHIVPRCLGGMDGRRNRQLTCDDCNIRKGGKHPLDYYRGLGFLL